MMNGQQPLKTAKKKANILHTLEVRVSFSYSLMPVSRTALSPDYTACFQNIENPHVRWLSYKIRFPPPRKRMPTNPNFLAQPPSRGIPCCSCCFVRRLLHRKTDCPDLRQLIVIGPAQAVSALQRKAAQRTSVTHPQSRVSCIVWLKGDVWVD